MCGICGIYYADQQKKIDGKLLEKMSEILKHRGPDDEGFYIKGNIGLGHRRLSIIDLSEAGHQPFSNERKNLWLTYNGEIYNFLELKEELKKLGHRFKSNSDSEVVLHGFEEWGTDCQNKFNGMWAFAVWDEEKKELFCSRDRFGEKPFYYYFDGRVFVFASEIKALLCLPFLKKEPNEKTIYDYLTFGGSNYGSETFFKNIKQLEPSHYLLLKGNNLEQKRYYQLPFNLEFGEFKNRSDELSQKFIELLTDSLKLRFRSDVRVGSCLSGGLDSSTIVCLIERLLKKGEIPPKIIGERLETFSSCSADRRFDERKHIEKIVEKKDITPYYTFPSGKEFWQDINDLVRSQEEPFRSASIYAHWRVMGLAREKMVKVLLVGEGGDELFGYPEQIGSYFNQMIISGKIPQFLKEFKAVSRNSDNLSAKRMIFLLTNQLLRHFLPPEAIFFFRKKKIEDLKLINPIFLKRYEYDEKFSKFSRLNFQQSLWENMTQFGLRGLLNFEDKNSMAFSIENRSPFLDYRLVEFVFGLPAVYKIHDGWTKYLMRLGTQDLLPEEIRWRRDKEGFLTPSVIWLRENKEKIKKIFEAKNFRSGEYLNRKAIVDNFEKNFTKCNLRIPEIWKYVSLELWFQKML